MKSAEVLQPSQTPGVQPDRPISAVPGGPLWPRGQKLTVAAVVNLVRRAKRSGAMGEFIRYFLVGLIAVGIDLVTTKVTKEILFASYPQKALTSEWLLVFIAGAAGCAVGMTAIYLMSLKFVFRHRAVNDKHVEFVMFMVIGVVSVVLQLGIYWLLNQLWIHYLEAALPHWGVAPDVVRFLDKRYYLFDKLVAIGVVFLFSFVSRRQLLFRKKHQPQPVPAQSCV